MRSDRGGGSLRLWPSPPGRWRQHRAESAGAVPGGDGEWPSEAGLAPGRRRLDGRGGPRLDWLPEVTWVDGPVCANHRVGRLSPGTWPSCARGWGLRGPSLSPCGVVARCETRLGDRRATCPAGAETGAGLPPPRPGWPFSLLAACRPSSCPILSSSSQVGSFRKPL